MGQGEQHQRTEHRVPRKASRHRQQQRQEQEQVAQLGDRRVGRQQLEALRTQRPPRAPQDRCTPEYAEHPAGRRGQHHVEQVEPQAQHEVEGRLDDQRRQRRADRGRGIGVRRGQPEVQREQGRLDQQAGGHQGQGDPGRRPRLQRAGQRRQVERAVAGIDQCHPGQKGHRAEQADRQVAQGGLQRRAAAAQCRQRDGRQAEQFQRDVDIEQVAGQQQRVQGGEEHQPQRPEGGAFFRGREVRGGVDTRSQPYQRAHQQQRGREPVGAQRDAEPRLPTTEGVLEGTARAHLGNDRQGAAQARRDAQRADHSGAPRPDDRGEAAEQRQRDRPYQQATHRRTPAVADPGRAPGRWH